MATKPDVPHAKVVAMADNIHKLLDLKAQEQGTMAELIRWCLWALEQTSEQAGRSLARKLMADVKAGRRPKHACVRMHEPAKKVSDDRKLAMLYLNWLATRLEDQSVRLPDTNQAKEDDHVHGRDSTPQRATS